MQVEQTTGSLRSRLMFTLIGGAAILAVLLFLIVRNYATTVAQQGQDNILSASATSVLSAAAIRNGSVEIDIPYAAFSMLSTEADDRVFYAVYQDADFLSGYADLVPVKRNTKANRTQNLLFETREFMGERVRMVSASRLLVGAEKRTEIHFSLAQTQDAMAVTLSQISRNAALIGVGFFALATLLSFWVAAATFGQLKRLTNSVTRRGPQDLRPFEKPVPSEMLPLVQSLNSLMGRLDHSLSQSEDFLAEAAHRIRTPLATVRSYAEATLQRVDKEENRNAVRSMVRAIDESSRAAGQLLDHAMIRFRADHLQRVEVDLIDLIYELVLRLAPIADMRDIELRFRPREVNQVTPIPCFIDPVLVQNAARNLIENALKYAPAETCVEVDIRQSQHVEIHVWDEGPGFAEDEIEWLVQRFKRGQNAKDTTGSGLGLTIAKDVAQAHGGDLTLSNRKGGGACLVLSLA